MSELRLHTVLTGRGPAAAILLTDEQIASLGAKFLELGVSAAGAGGYARELTAEERVQLQTALGDHL